MNLNDFVVESSRTDANMDSNKVTINPNIFHALLGIITEAGELFDIYKKNLAYGREVDIVNVEEEIGDMMWYLSKLCRVLNLDFEKILFTNLEKLKARYPEKFTEELANTRNLEKERKILEELGFRD